MDFGGLALGVVLLLFVWLHGWLTYRRIDREAERLAVEDDARYQEVCSRLSELRHTVERLCRLQGLDDPDGFDADNVLDQPWDGPEDLDDDGSVEQL